MWKRILITAASVYVPMVILSIVWASFQKRDLERNLADIQERNILDKSYYLADECQVLIEITSYWSHVVFPNDFLKDQAFDSLQIANYIQVLQGVDEFDQFRVIDLHGQEILRYEKTGKNKMDRREVQNKVNRPYFKKGLALKKGQVYISPIELNVENGSFEIPHKPVMRGVTPIFAEDGHQLGMVVLNFDLSKIFDLMNAKILEDNFYLLDGHLNLITSNMSAKVLAHQSGMNKEDSLLMAKLPKEDVRVRKDTFFLKRGSLWVHRNVDIGYGEKLGLTRYPELASIIMDNDWSLLQEIPSTKMALKFQPIQFNLWLFNGIMFTIILIVALGYAKREKERQDFVLQLQTQQEQLQESQLSLKKSNQNVRESNDKLKIRNKQLEDFNYVVAHNLKAPVSSMSIIVDMIKENNDQGSFKELFPKLEAVSNNIVTLTQDVETYISILNNQRIKLVNENLLVLAKEVEGDFAGDLLNMKKGQFEINYIFESWHTVKCSKFYMKSVIHNLMSNALKYRKQDVPSYLILETAMEKGKKILYVRDNGLGIDLSRHSKNMFKLYKRFHRNISGKGMGLFIVQSQLHAMNATIEVQSEPGTGTTFKIKFN